MGDQSSAHRVLVIVNKSWEADPLVSVCLNPKLRPASLWNWSPGAAGLFSTPGNGARPSDAAPAPRCTCTSGSSIVEVWCIEDWMGNSNHSSFKVKIEQSPTPSTLLLHHSISRRPSGPQKMAKSAWRAILDCPRGR